MNCKATAKDFLFEKNPTNVDFLNHEGDPIFSCPPRGIPFKCDHLTLKEKDGEFFLASYGVL